MPELKIHFQRTVPPESGHWQELNVSFMVKEDHKYWDIEGMILGY